MSLAHVAEARKLAFPLLGLEASVPDFYTIDEAGPARVVLSRKSNPVGLSFYRVEFGNLEKFTASHNKDLEKFLRRRLGKGARVEFTRSRAFALIQVALDMGKPIEGKPWVVSHKPLLV